MTKRVFGGFGTAVMGLSCSPGPRHRGTVRGGPWGRVPAFPTTCYSNDAFFDTVVKAIEALDADLARQTAINADNQSEVRRA